MDTPKNRTEIALVLELLKKGFTKPQIRKKLDMKPSALSYHLGKLEDLGCIERKGNYVIKVNPISVRHPRVTKNQFQLKQNKRGHAFNFKVYFPREKNLLEKPKVKHEFKTKNLEELPFGSLKLVKDKCSIWINKKTLTIYSNNSYYSDNALHSKFRALKDIDNLIIYLKDRFGFSGYYGIEVFREHYGLIFNKFAQWILKRGRKLYVKEKGNKTILWVDNSRKDDEGLEEFETDDPLRANNSDNYFKSHEKTGWKVTPENVLKMFNESGELIFGLAEQTKKNAEHLAYHAENMRSHVQATRDLSAGIKKQNKLFEKIAEVLEKDGR